MNNALEFCPVTVGSCFNLVLHAGKQCQQYLVLVFILLFFIFRFYTTKKCSTKLYKTFLLIATNLSPSQCLPDKTEQSFLNVAFISVHILFPQLHPEH